MHSLCLKLVLFISPQTLAPDRFEFESTTKHIGSHDIIGKLPEGHIQKQYITIYFIYLFGVLRRFQHCTGHITTGSWKGRGNQYIQFVRILYCKLPTHGKQLPAFPLEAVPGIEPRPQRWEARVLQLYHRGPYNISRMKMTIL